MTIKLLPEDYNAIMKSCKAFVDAKGTGRVGTDTIHLICDGKCVKALALDGYKALNYICAALPGSDECRIAITPLKPVKPKETPFVKIAEDGGKVTVETATGSQSVLVDQPCDDMHRTVYRSIFAKDSPVKSVYFSPKLLAETFAAIPTACVRIDFYNEKRPIEIYAVADTAKYHAIALPMRNTASELSEVRDAE